MRRLLRQCELRPGNDGRIELTAVGLGGTSGVTRQPQTPKLPARLQHSGLLDRAAGASRRALGNHRESQRLAETHPVRRLAEVDPAGGANALDIAAEGREGEIRDRKSGVSGK